MKRLCVICQREYTNPHPVVLTCNYECSAKLREQRRRERYLRSKLAAAQPTSEGESA